MPLDDNLLKLAEESATEAGNILRQGGTSLREINFSDSRDVKLKADEDSETLIRKLLSEGSGLPVVGEEFGGNKELPEGDSLYWVVDPLDGTYNYLRGSPECAVSIGLLRGTEPLLGVVYNFNLDVLYSGEVGKGFRLNGNQYMPSWAEKVADAAIATGFPAGMDRSPEQMEQFIQRIAPFKKVRMVGSAATALAYVAAGTYDVYYEETSRLWDVAAGVALVKAAGGTIRMKPSPSGKDFAYDVWAAGRADLIA